MEEWLESLPLPDDTRKALTAAAASAPLLSQLSEVRNAIRSLPPNTQVMALKAIATDPEPMLKAAVHAWASAKQDRAENAEWCFVLAACADAPDLVYELADERKLHGFAKGGMKKSTLFYLAKISDPGWAKGIKVPARRAKERTRSLIELLLDGRWPKTERSEIGSLGYGLLHHRPAELLRLIAELPNGTQTARGKPFGAESLDVGEATEPLGIELFSRALAESLFSTTATLESISQVAEQLVGHDYQVWRAKPAELPKQHEFLNRLAAAEKDVPVILEVARRPFLAAVGAKDHDLVCRDPTHPERLTRVPRTEGIAGLCAPKTFVEHFLEGKALPSLEAGDPHLHWFSR